MGATISWLSSVLLAAAVAPSEPLLELDWQAPEHCPDRAWALARLASDARLTKLERRTLVRVRLSEAENGFVADMKTEQGDAQGTRSLEAATCEEVAEAAIVVLGMALVPRPHDAVQPSVVPAASPAPPPPKTEPEASPPPASGTLPAFLRGGVGVDSGSLPSTTFGIVLAGGFRFGAASFGLEGSYWLPRAARAEDPEGLAEGADVGGEFSRADARLFGCWASPEVGLVSVEGCLGFGVALLNAEGYGVPEPTTERRVLGFAQGELGLPLRLSRRAGLRLAAGVVVPTSRETYAIGKLGNIFTPDPLGFRAEITSEVKF